MKNKKRLNTQPIIAAILIVTSIFSWHTLTANSDNAFPDQVAQAMEEAYFEVTEGNDFATQVMRDPWDMSEFTDISHYLNPAGSPTLLTDIQVNSGIFSAHSTITKQGAFYPLFPGYIESLLIGKIGAQYPINPNKYRCLYTAAKVDSGPAEGGAPDQMVIYWFANEFLNGSTFGQTLPGIVLYPEAGAGTPTPRWKLYSARLDQVASHLVPWLSAPNGQWRGLRINPTLQNTSFAFDWVRLTDCAPVPINLPWSGSGPVSVSIIPEGTSRDIQVATNVSANPYVLDAQGLQVGTYNYLIRNGSSVVGSGSFKVKPVPVVNFKNPSTLSGTDYATQTGNPWDMNSTADISEVQCTSTRIADGKLYMDTLSVENQPTSCIGGWVPDPGISFTTPLPIDTSQYRYLSFRMFTDAPYSNFGSGMVVRWVWFLQGVSGLPANRCILVTSAVPYDVGWYTVSVDMFDAIEGKAIQTSVVDCPAGLDWTDNSPALLIRFDPNENISGQTFHQQLDWIKLTKNPEVTRGTSYPIDLELNIPWAEISSYQVYYTTDPNSPYQFPAAIDHPQLITPLAPDLSPLFLPMIVTSPVSLDKLDSLLPYSQSLVWNTGAVARGTYYLCIQAVANGKSITYCSNAPITVK